MAIEEKRKSPIDWSFGPKEINEDGTVSINVTLVFHDMDIDSYIKREVKKYNFEPGEVEVGVKELADGERYAFSKVNVVKKYAKEIGEIDEKLKKYLAKFAEKSLTDKKMAPSSKVYFEKEFFFNDYFARKMFYEIVRLTVIKKKVETFSNLDIIKANGTLLDRYIGVVYYY